MLDTLQRKRMGRRPDLGTLQDTIARTAVKPQEVQTLRLINHLRDALLRGVDQRERAHVLFLDANRRYLGEIAIGVGGVASLVLEPRKILDAGFGLGARGMILAHNHPSGDCRPSRADVAATWRLAWLGRMVDLLLLDHFIITATGVYSMRAGGTL
jgi:DNA repair protein RadC